MEKCAKLSGASIDATKNSDGSKTADSDAKTGGAVDTDQSCSDESGAKMVDIDLSYYPGEELNIARSCSRCYVKLELHKIWNCGACDRRAYCGSDCQEEDWKQHKIWCNRAIAQLDIDFEIRLSEYGMGVFAKRDITVGEKILAERSIIRLPEGQMLRDMGESFRAAVATLPLSVKEAISSLHPEPADTEIRDNIFKETMGECSLQMKYNSFGLADGGGGDSGIFVIASRFNHSCIPNCGRTFVDDYDLMLIFADQSIKKGEEMTISYTAQYESAQQFKSHMNSVWKFECKCRVCQDSNLFLKLLQVHINDDIIEELGGAGNVNGAYELGLESLKLYDELGIGAVLRQRVYYDMFQMSILHRKTLESAKMCAKKHLQYITLVYGGSNKEPSQLKMAKELNSHVEDHELYCGLD